MHSDETRWSRRRWLATVGAGVSAGLAGCVGSDAGPTIAVSGEAPCADAVAVTEEAARVVTGQRPEVRLRLRNTGDVPVAYEVRVVFLQGTSLGIDARTGRTTLDGTLGPGETTTRVATDDARDVRNTDTYELDVSVACAES
jgi:hypothetical protein